MIEPHAPPSEAAFQDQFVRLRDSLTAYLFRITANRQDAEDLAQDTYLKAVQKLGGFAGRSSVKTWVFAIATNLARDHHRARRRWFEDTQDRCRETTQDAPEKVKAMRRLADASPAERYEFREHIDYCFTCLAKTLVIEQQLALILKDVYGFKVSEIMQILHLSEGRVKHALAAARRTMVGIYDRRCVLVSKQGVCHQCSEINGFINSWQDAHQEALQETLLREAEAGSPKEHLYDLRMELIRGIDPLDAPGAEVHAYLLERMDEEVMRAPASAAVNGSGSAPRGR
jgi:RNA polymerase sigma-70 factor (ECF subfamily)